MVTLKPLVFFGSGPVAAKSLSLLAKNFTIEAVVTKPKPTHHSGSFPVIDVAEQLGLTIIETRDKAQLTQQMTNHRFRSNLGVVIDYGIIIPRAVIDQFKLGIVNSHFSLLPQWRGADPITFSILSGQAKTGVSLMLIVEKMDEGPLLAQAGYEIQPDETAPSLTEALIELSDKTLAAIIPLYLDGETMPAPQEEVSIAEPPQPTYSRKLTKSDGILDFDKPAYQLEREVRAFLGWPGSRTNIWGYEVIVTAAHAVPGLPGKPGQIEALPEGVLMVQASEGYLCIDKLKPAGRKEMSAADFIRGYRA